MLTNRRRRELLNNVRASGYPGSISEVFQAALQGRDLVREFEVQQNQQQEQQMQVAQTQEEQETGLREEHAAGNTQASMAFPDVQPNQSFNTVGMQAPIDIQKVDDQGHLVESYKNVPPGIQDLPTGPAEGTIIESPAAYQKGGFNFNTAKDYSAKKTNYYSPEAIQERSDSNPYKGLSLSEKLDLGLTTAGMAPGLGVIPDAINTVSNLGQGAYHTLAGDKEQASQDYKNAAWAAGGMIPIAGQAVASTKLGIKFAKGASSKIKFLDNVKDRIIKDSKSGLGYYGRKEFPINPDLTLKQKNLAKHLSKTGTGGTSEFPTTSLYRYGDEALDMRGESGWYSADPTDPFRYQEMRGSGKKVFKIDVENQMLPEMYRGGPQQGTGFGSATEFKEFEVPDWMTGKFGNQQTFESMKDYKAYLNTLKRKGGVRLKKGGYKQKFCW